MSSGGGGGGSGGGGGAGGGSGPVSSRGRRKARPLGSADGEVDVGRFSSASSASSASVGSLASPSPSSASLASVASGASDGVVSGDEEGRSKKLDRKSRGLLSIKRRSKK